jgi:hypothetical protein
MSARQAFERNDLATTAGDAALFSAILVAFMPVNLVVAPLLSYFLHRRRIDRPTLVWGAVGLVLGGVLAVGSLLLLVTLGRLIEPSNWSEFTGGIVLLTIASAAFAALAIALDVAAISDLATRHAGHLRLDVARLVATALLLVGTAVVVAVQLRSPGSQIADVGPFALMSALISAATVFIGAALSARWESRRRAHSASIILPHT